MTYDVDYFIKKFEAIPDGRWCTNDFERDGACCAYGHLGVRDNHCTIATRTFESNAFCDLFAKFDLFVININDGIDLRYMQINPKQRIMAALYDIKKLQTKES